jgi:arsenate reductase-like glutaredoxin family protein
MNKKGTTWKLLPKEIQETITNQKAAIALMTEKTSIIRRPLIEADGKILVIGFDETEYKKALK